MVNVVIPMAGLGKRFSDDGFMRPKPLIKINDVPMIQKAIESLGIDGRYIFITRKTEYSEEIHEHLRRIKPECLIREIDYVTDGPASTVNLVRDEINNDDQLVVANCDQIMWWDGGAFIYYCQYHEFDGVIVTYVCDSTKNSYARIDMNGLVQEIREKEVISDISLNGIHYWRRGLDFINSYDKMVEEDDRAVNGEFYVGPSYNQMIKRQNRVGIYHIPRCQHHAVGTPDDLREYIRNENLQFK